MQSLQEDDSQQHTENDSYETRHQSEEYVEVEHEIRYDMEGLSKKSKTKQHCHGITQNNIAMVYTKFLEYAMVDFNRILI